MVNREQLKLDIDRLPDDAVERVREFIDFQKCCKGIWEDDTDYLSSIPGMKESILESGAVSAQECLRDEDMNWNV